MNRFIVILLTRSSDNLDFLKGLLSVVQYGEKIRKMLSLFLIEKSEISCFDIMTVMDMCVELLSKKNHIYL